MAEAFFGVGRDSTVFPTQQYVNAFGMSDRTCFEVFLGNSACWLPPLRLGSSLVIYIPSELIIQFN